MTTPHLNACTVAKAALEAYDKKQLQAQNRVPGTESCSYKDPVTGCPCAIGVSYQPRKGRNNHSIDILIQAGLVTTSEPQLLYQLQELHDTWLFKQTPETEAAFVEFARKVAAS